MPIAFAHLPRRAGQFDTAGRENRPPIAHTERPELLQLRDGTGRDIRETDFCIDGEIVLILNEELRLGFAI